MRVERQRPPQVDIIMREASERFSLTQQREGIHLTDTIYCLRKAYWNQVSPLPPTKLETLYFLLGLGLQQALLGGDNPSVAELDGILISPDYWEDGVLGELKTTRMGVKRLEEGLPDGWVKQMKGYAHVLGVSQCFLIVIPIIRPEEVPFVLSFEKEELEENS